jgi:hypothetical protein
MWIEVPARDDYYYILLRGESIDDTNIPVAVLRRLAGNLVLTDLPSVPRDTAFYRVRQVHSASAFDSEQDGVAQSGGPPRNTMGVACRGLYDDLNRSSIASLR